MIFPLWSILPFICMLASIRNRAARLRQLVGQEQ